MQAACCSKACDKSELEEAATGRLAEEAAERPARRLKLAEVGGLVVVRSEAEAEAETEALAK